MPVDKPPSELLFCTKTEPGPNTEELACWSPDEAAPNAELLALDIADSTASAAFCVELEDGGAVDVPGVVVVVSGEAVLGRELDSVVDANTALVVDTLVDVGEDSAELNKVCEF